MLGVGGLPLLCRDLPVGVLVPDLIHKGGSTSVHATLESHGAADPLVWRRLVCLAGLPD